jgi:hypothetical protein
MSDGHMQGLRGGGRAAEQALTPRFAAARNGYYRAPTSYLLGEIFGDLSADYGMGAGHE